MPVPKSPVFSDIGEGPQVTFAKDQPEYEPLPALCTAVAVLSRWQFSDAERKAIADGADVFVMQMNFSQPLQPISLFITDNDAEVKKAFMKAGA